MVVISDFFSCLVRLVQTFRSRNNHNHNNNNTNAGPIWPEFYYYYIYLRPPRSRSLLHLAKPFVHTRTNRFFFSRFSSLLWSYILYTHNRITAVRRWKMRPAHLPLLFGALGILYTYFAADHRWQMANIDVHIYTAHTLYIIYRYVGMRLNIIMLVYVRERVLRVGEGVPRETKQQTVILGGCFNVYSGVVAQYTCILCRFLHDNNIHIKF